MPRFAANLSMLFTEVDFMDRFAAAAKAGFSGVEYLFPYDFPAEEIKAQLDANGLTQALFNLPAGDWAGGDRGIACHPDRIAEFQRSVDTAITYAEATGCTRLNCLAGIATAGEARQRLEDVLVANLAYAAPLLASAGIQLLLEPINPIDIPGYLINSTDDY